MKVRIEGYHKDERVKLPANDEEAKRFQLEKAEKYIVESFVVSVVEPKAESFYGSCMSLAAEVFPPDTQVGDEFTVYFERATKQ